MTIRSKNKLKESEIRKLFDAIAKEKGEGDVDTDIPGSRKAFANAIQRKRPNWGNVLMVWYKEMKAILNNNTSKTKNREIFHTLLGLMEVETAVYDKRMDIATPCN